jgi:hypothetical protein
VDGSSINEDMPFSTTPVGSFPIRGGGEHGFHSSAENSALFVGFCYVRTADMFVDLGRQSNREHYLRRPKNVEIWIAQSRLGVVFCFPIWIHTMEKVTNSSSSPDTSLQAWQPTLTSPCEGITQQHHV